MIKTQCTYFNWLYDIHNPILGNTIPCNDCQKSSNSWTNSFPCLGGHSTEGTVVHEQTAVRVTEPSTEPDNCFGAPALGSDSHELLQAFPLLSTNMNNKLYDNFLSFHLHVLIIPQDGG